MLQGIGSDLRYVLRVLRGSPGFTLVAVASLAMGIGANTAMFGVVRTLLLTPLPVEAPEELSVVTWRRDGDFSISQIGSGGYTDPEGGARLRSNVSAPIYEALRDAAPEGTELFAFAFLRGVSVAVTDGPPLLAGGALADGAYFPVLGVPMALGRPLSAADDRPDAPLVAVLSHAFWMRALGGDPAALGRTIRVNGSPAEVVGVTAPGFVGMSMGGFFPRTEITLPLAAQPRVYPRMGDGLFSAQDVFWLRVMARSRDGAGASPAVEATLAQAMTGPPSPLAANDGHRPVVRLISGAQGTQPVRPQVRSLLYLLLGVVASVLLIACVNLASLMLARGITRRREMGVRRALGGSRGRLVRQMLLEGLVLAGAGTLGGLALTLGTRALVGELLTGSLGSGAFGDVGMRVGLDPVVLAVSAGLGLGATLLFGLWPALRMSRTDPMAWLRPGGGGAPRLTVGRVLIAVQIGVSVPLVVGAVLLLRTVTNLGAVELGFEPRGIVTVQVDPGFTQRAEEDWPELYRELLARVGEVPGVRSITLVENALLSGIVSNGSAEVEGERHMAHRNAVGPGFLETLGMELVAGRTPGLQDGPDAPLVGVVNRTAVAELFGGASPLGRTVRMGGRDVRVVGVVNDVPYRSRRAPVPPILYDAALQRNGYGGHHLVLRTDVPVARLERAVREAVFQVDADLPVPELRAQTELMAATSARERVFSQLLTAFGAFALLLASIGLHGVTAYSVSRRTREIGVRVAVGARPGQVLWLVLRQVVALGMAGLVLGIPVALAGGRVVESLLFGVEPTDPATLAVAGGTLLLVAAAAGAIPAVRAARMDALGALRVE